MKKIISAVRRLSKKKRSDDFIQGYLENIEHLEIRGWAIQRNNEPLTLQLRIQNTLYPVTAKWHERADVAKSVGNQDFLNAGFIITVRDAFLDEFLLARQQHKPIDVLANGILLGNRLKYPAMIPDNTVELLKEPPETDDTSINADYYLKLAKQHLTRQNIDGVRLALKIAISFECRSEFLELLANTYFEVRDYETAAAYYQLALKNNGTIQTWSLSKLIHCQKRLTHLEEVCEFLLTQIRRNPKNSFLLEHLDETITDYWSKQQAVFDALTFVNDRVGLLEKMNAITAFVYDIYLRSYGCRENPVWVGSCNSKRVLIVANFQTAQTASLIEQKIQHFKAAGITATAIASQNLVQEQQTLILHDIVIFYQTPADPEVLKAMALLNAAGKLSCYETDSLEFDPAYPPAIKNNTRHSELDVYLQSVKNMAGLNAAARYCRLGISSTQAVADKLQALVFDKHCLVNDNGLDSLSGNALAATQSAKQTKRQKIVLVNVFFPPQAIGGGTRVVSDNFDILQRDYAEEFEVCVFTSDAEHKSPYRLSIYSHQGARVYRCSVCWHEYMDWYAFDDKMYALFSEFLQLEQPDLVHFHCVQRLTASVVAAARDMNIPYLVTVHDAWWISDYQFLVDANHRVYPDGHPDPAQPCPPPAGISLTDSSTRISSLKALLHDARMVLTVSESFAQLYRKNGIPQIQVNKNGLSDSVIWQSKETNYTAQVVCGHVGGMAEHKGFFLFKAAVEKLQPQHIEFLIVDHDKEEDYQHKTHWGNVPVRFIGRVNQADIVDLYKQLDVLFAPSMWPESYGLVTREAAACGCWVVASTMGGIGEDIIEGKSGFRVNPSQEELIQCLKHIDEHSEQFKAVAQSTNLRQVSAQVAELAVLYKRLSS